jgi:uncharacterized membrane protein YfcA
VTYVAVLIGAIIGARMMIRIKSGLAKSGFGLITWIFAAQLILKLTGVL